MSQEEEEDAEDTDLGGSSFKEMVLDWSGPDLVYTTVSDWILDPTHSGKSTVGNCFQYCFTFAKDLEEDYELKLWMLNLVKHYVTEDESWLENADDAKDWSRLSLTSDWEVSPPIWAKKREEEEEKRNTEETEKTKESLECVTASPLDPSWGKGLPAPNPTVAAPSTPAWRPWEEEIRVVNLSVREKRKRRSPAAAARSRRRLWQWQEKMDRNRNRLESELRITPQRSVEQMRGTRLLDRLESRQFEVEDHLLNGRQQEEGGEIVCASAKGSWVEGKTVFVSNQTQTSMLPQSFKPSMSTFAPVMSSPSTLGDCGTRFGVPNVVTLCPTCHAWGLLSPA